MKEALRENLNMGAVGFSIGLDYYPTLPDVVSTEELTELAAVTKIVVPFLLPMFALLIMGTKRCAL